MKTNNHGNNTIGSKGLSRGESQAARSSRRQREVPVEFRDTPPLTVEQFHTLRREAEAKERERVKKLREDWEAHEKEVRKSYYEKL